MTENRRFENINDIKVILIVLIILGHCMLFYAGNPFFPQSAGFTVPAIVHICSFLDAFFIPSFVFCSGFLFTHIMTHKERSMAQCLKERTKRLLLPYYIYGSFWIVPLYTAFDIKCFGRDSGTGLIEGYKYMAVGIFSDHLWFLWLLFWVNTVFILLRSLLQKKYLPALFLISLAVALVVQLCLQSFPYFKLSQTAPYYLCFCIGVIAYMYYDRIEKLPGAVLFILSAVLMTGAVLYGRAQQIHFVLDWLCKMTSMCGIFLLSVLLDRFEAVKKLRKTKVSAYIDKHSFRFFLMNCPLLYLFFRLYYPLIGNNAALCVAANFISTVVSLCIITYIQDKTKDFVKELREQNG